MLRSCEACSENTDWELRYLNERQKRKHSEESRQHLLAQVEAQELEIEELRKTLYTRVADAEVQMEKLIRLREEETVRAENSIAKLRCCIEKLQKRHSDEKIHIQQVLDDAQNSLEVEMRHLQERLLKTESDRDCVAEKLKKSESTVNKLNTELKQLRTELSDASSRMCDALQSKNETNAKMNELKKSYERALQRAENSSKQLADLRKEAEKANTANTRSEEALRIAVERRTAAESALALVRKRADTQSQRVVQLERDLASEKARIEEKQNVTDAEVRKLRRRIVSLQNESEKLKNQLQHEQNHLATEKQRLEETIDDLSSENASLQSQLKEMEEQHVTMTRSLELLKYHLGIKVSGAVPSWVACEQGCPSTIVELRRAIREHMEHEVQVTKKDEEMIEAEMWRGKYEACQRELDECRVKIEATEKQHQQQQQAIPQHELNALQQKLIQTEDALDGKTRMLTEQEEQLNRCRSEIAELKSQKDQLQSAHDERIHQLTNQVNDLSVKYSLTAERLRVASRLVSKFKNARNVLLDKLARLNGEGEERANNQELTAMKEKLVNSEKRVAEAETKLRKLHEELTSTPISTEHYEAIIVQLKDRLELELQRSEYLWALFQANPVCEELEIRSIPSPAHSDESGRSNHHLASMTNERYVDQYSVDSGSHHIECKEQELKELRETMLERVTYAQQKLDAAQRRTVELEQQKAELEQQLQKTKCALASEEEENARIREQVTELNQELIKCKSEKIEFTSHLCLNSMEPTLLGRAEEIMMSDGGDFPHLMHSDGCIQSTKIRTPVDEPHLDAPEKCNVKNKIFAGQLGRATLEPYQFPPEREFDQPHDLSDKENDARKFDESLSTGSSLENLWNTDKIAVELEELIERVNRQLG